MNKILIFLATGWLCLLTLAVAAQPTFYINPTPLVGNTGQSITADVTADNFTDIVSTQFHLIWNNAVIRYDSISSTVFGLPGMSVGSNFNVQNSGNNSTLIFSWLEANTNPVTIASGTTIFRIHFTILQATNTNLTFSNQEVIKRVGASDVEVTSQSTFANGYYGASTSSGNLTISMGSGTGQQGSQQCINVAVSNFDSVLSFQHSINWNPAVLRFESVSGMNLQDLDAGTFGTGTAVSNGQMTVSWFDADVVGVTVPNGTVIYQLCFTVLGNTGASTSISVTNSPTPIEASQQQNGLSVVTNITAQNGTFTVSTGGTTPVCTPGTGFYMIGSRDTAAIGEVACIDISTQDFDDILSAQYSLQWDPAKLQFNSVQIPAGAANVLGLSSGSFNTNASLTNQGRMTFSWSDDAVAGVTIPDGTTIYGVCFNVLNVDVVGTDITFTSTPTVIEVTSNASSNITFSSCPGNISLADETTVTPLVPTAQVTGFCNPPSTGTGGGGTTPCNPGAGFYQILSDPIGDVGTQVCVEVTTTGFDDILSMQYLLRWDPTVLQYASVTLPAGAANQIGLSTSNFNTSANFVNSGKISLSWFDNNVEGISVPNNTLLYTVCFNVLQDIPTQVTVGGDAATPVEIIYGNGTEATLNSCVGEVNSGGGTPPVLNNNGSIDLSVSGGTTPYTYSWSNGATTQDLSGLSEGTYTVTITDGQGQDTILSYFVGVMQIVSANTSPATSGNNGAIDITVQGGSYPPAYTYLWSNGATTQDLNNIAPGTYYLTVTDAANCMKKDTIIVANNAAPLAVGVTTITNILCFGQSTGAINITPSGGVQPYTYAWSNNAGTTQDISGRLAGTYTVTVTDALNSTVTAQATISQPNAALFISGTATPEIVPPGNNGSITTTTTGGTQNYSYTWNQPGIGNTGTAVGLSTGNYIITVTDANGCTASTGIIPVPQTSTFQIQPTIINASCGSTANGAINLTISGGSGDFTFVWSPNVGTTQNVTNLLQGTYQVTVTDNVSTVQTTATIIVGVNGPDIIITLDNITPQQGLDGQNNPAQNGAVYISVTGGGPYAYEWNYGMPDPITSQDLIDVPAGTYMVTITDTNSSCTAVSNEYVVPSLLGLATSAITPACNGTNGCVSFTIYGGQPPFTYAWSDAISQVNASRTVSRCGLPAGTVSVTITDGLGQQYVIPSSFDVPNTQIQITNQTVTAPSNGCNGSVVLSVEGAVLPATYAWSNTPPTTTQNLLNACPGDYQVTITDANGCSFTSPLYTLLGNTAIQVTGTTTSVTCPLSIDGAIDVRVIGGGPDYTYAWSHNGVLTDLTTEDISGIQAGTWEVTVTSGTNIITRTFIINSASTLTITPLQVQQPTQDVCDGEVSVAVLSGVPPYNFLWSNGFTTQNVTNLCAGNYIVTVTDAAGCTMVDTATLSINPILTVNISAFEYGAYNVSCNGECDGVAAVQVSGGSGNYTYQWSSGHTGTQANDLCKGLVSVTVSDGVNPPVVRAIQINEPDELIVQLTSTPALNGNDGTASVVATGGTGNYTFRWSDNGQSTTQTITSLRPGEYFVLVIDGNQCNVLKSIQVSGKPIDESNCFTTIRPVITPNDDGYNEEFIIYCADQVENTLQIFDRWGRQVFVGTNYQNNWKGVDASGTKVPDGSYFYLLDVITNSGDRKQFKGSFTVLTK